MLFCISKAFSLGINDAKAGNFDQAIKHWLIEPALGIS
jgi:hypothetical protein